MKITKRQLRKIIREEKARVLREQADSDVDVYDITITVAIAKGENPSYIQQSIEDGMEFDKAAGEGILDFDIRPGTPEGVPPKGGVPPRTHRTPTEKESGIPDSKRSVIHNRRPDW